MALVPDLNIAEEVIKENNMTGEIDIIQSNMEDLVLLDGITQLFWRMSSPQIIFESSHHRLRQVSEVRFAS